MTVTCDTLVATCGLLACCCVQPSAIIAYSHSCSHPKSTASSVYQKLSSLPASPTALPPAGLAALPSCLARMDAGEFVARMQRGNPCGLPPLVYGGGAEYLYFQAQLPPALLQDVDLAAAPFVLPSASRGCGDGSRSGTGSPAQQLRQTQAARVWVGPQGAVSPNHYDTSHSFLTQIRGR